MDLFARHKAAERLEHRLGKVEDLCSALERDAKKLDLEFTDLYDKVRRQMSRMAKRYAIDQKENGELVEPATEVEPGPEIDPVSAHELLSTPDGRLRNIRLRR